VNDSGEAGIDKPLQLGRALAHIDAGDGAFAQADGAAVGRVAVSVAIAADETRDELMQVGIVADDEEAFAAGVLGDELLEGSEIAVRGQGCGGEDGRVEGDLGGDELGCLAGSLERAGDDDIDLSLESREHACHEHALLLTLFDESALGVEDWIFAGDASVCVAH